MGLSDSILYEGDTTYLLHMPIIRRP
jgi:hypothetical protein